MSEATDHLQRAAAQLAILRDGDQRQKHGGSVLVKLLEAQQAALEALSKEGRA